MILAVTACKTNAQDAADAAAANASGYSSGQAAGTASAQADAIRASGFITALYTSLPSTSYTFQLVKFGQSDANFAVIKVTGGANETFAVNVANYTTGTNYLTYVSTNPSFFNLTANGDGTYSCKSGTCTNYLGAATSSSLVFEKTGGSVKDLEKAAALVEQYRTEALAAGLASEFGLSDDRSIEVAKLATSWEKLSKTRALTNADANSFAQELAGVNFSQINNAAKAMVNGSTGEMNSIIIKAAEVNGTTSENMSAIMMKLFF